MPRFRYEGVGLRAYLRKHRSPLALALWTPVVVLGVLFGAVLLVEVISSQDAYRAASRDLMEAEAERLNPEGAEWSEVSYEAGSCATFPVSFLEVSFSPKADSDRLLAALAGRAAIRGWQLTPVESPVWNGIPVRPGDRVMDQATRSRPEPAIDSLLLQVIESPGGGTRVKLTFASYALGCGD